MLRHPAAMRTPLFALVLVAAFLSVAAPAFAVDLRLMAAATAPTLAQHSASAAALWRQAVLDVHRRRTDAPAALKTPEFQAVLATACEVISACEAPDPMPAAAMASAAALAGTRDIAALLADYFLHCRYPVNKDLVAKARALLSALNADERKQGGKPRFPSFVRLPALSVSLFGLMHATDPVDQQRAIATGSTVGAVLAATLRSGMPRDQHVSILTWCADLNFSDPRVGTAILAELDPLQGAPGVPAALLDACRANLHRTQAWAYRGGGYADSVTPAGWEGFQRHLGKANALAESAWKADPQLRGVALIGLTLAGAFDGATSDADTWLRRGLNTCRDDGPLFRKRVQYLLPRWGGSYAAMIDLAGDLLTAGEAEPTLNELWFLRIITMICQYVIFDQAPILPDAKAVFKDRTFQARFAALAERVIAAHPSDAHMVHFRRAVLLWHGGQTAAAEAIFRTLPEPAQVAEQAAREWKIELTGLGAPPAGAIP